MNRFCTSNDASSFVLVLTLACATAARAGENAVWRQIQHPGIRHQHAAAYDEARQRYVVFSGRTASDYSTETHEYDGVLWHRVFDGGPPHRDGHAMAYDPVRQRVVLFGGVQSIAGGTNYLGDTWDWDGETWTQRAASGPSPRERHAMAFDRARGRLVLFGGFFAQDGGGVTYFGDTWEWDGRSWTMVAGAEDGPGRRWAANMVYDRQHGAVLLYGGAGPAEYSGETWAWDGGQWTPVTDQGPPCRAFHAMTYDATRNRTVVFGGASPCVNFPFVADQQDTWEWDGSVWTEVATTGPFKRRFATLAFDSARDTSILYGGWPANYLPEGGGPQTQDIPLGDVWEWDGQQWTQRATTVPRGRSAHDMAYDAARDVTVLYGGRVGIFNFEPETWEWDGQGWTRKTFGGPIGPNNPQARGRHAMAYDARRHRVWMFGGARNNAGDPFDETWWWNGETWNEHIPAIRPTARWWHTMVYDAAHDRLVVFGGFDDAGGLLGDTWEFDGSDWQLRSAAGPAPRIGHAMAYDAARQRTVIFGGQTPLQETDGVAFSGETWEWDGQSWTLMSSTGPPPRADAAMAYDSDRERIVMRGGLNAGPQDGVQLLDDTWAWDGGAWHRLNQTGPGPHTDEVMVYEPTRRRMFLYGGTDLDATFYEQMWILRVGPPGDGDSDGDVDLADFAAYLDCVVGPNEPATPECAFADFDEDGDVDLADLQQLLAAFTGETP